MLGSKASQCSLMTMLSSITYIFDPRPRLPFVASVKQYSWPQTSRDGVTLIFCHGLGHFNELWEPVLQDLLEAEIGKGERHSGIREIWAIEAPHHGESGVLNESILQELYSAEDVIFPCAEYTKIVHAFILGLGSGVPVDFSSHKVVGIGHSMGTVSLMMSQQLSPPLEFHLLILVELLAINPAYFPVIKKQIRGTAIRRDVWSSRETALTYMTQNSAWRKWDSRSLNAFTAHGLRNLPTAYHPDLNSGVTLKTTRQLEAATFLDEASLKSLYLSLEDYTRNYAEFHLVYGTSSNFVPPPLQADVLARCAGGRNRAPPLHQIDGAGHLVPQTHPKELARVIHSILKSDRPGVAFDIARL